MAACHMCMHSAQHASYISNSYVEADSTAQGPVCAQVNYSRYVLQGLTWSEEHGKVFAKAESIITGLPGRSQSVQPL